MSPRCGAVLVLLVALGVRGAEGSGLLAVSFSQISAAAANASATQGFPLGVVRGLIVDDKGEIYLLGSRTQSNSLTYLNIATVIRLVIGTTEGVGIRATADVAAGGRRLRLIYSGGIENTPIGLAFADTLLTLNEAALGKGRLPPGFWPLAKSFEGKFVVTSRQPRCDDPSEPKVVVVDGAGVSLVSKSIASEARKEVRTVGFEWARQVADEYHYLRERRGALALAGRFLALYSLLAVVRDRFRLGEVKNFLMVSRIVADGRSPRTLHMHPSAAFVRRIGVAGRGDAHCRADAGLGEWRRLVLRGIHNAGDRGFTSPVLLRHVSLPADAVLKQFTNALRLQGLSGRSVFLDLNRSARPPTLRFLAQGRISVRPIREARELEGLVRGSLDAQAAGVAWNDFFRTRLASFLPRAAPLRPVVGLLSDDVDPSWRALQRDGGLARTAMLFPLRVPRGAALETVVDFLRNLASIPTIGARKPAVVVSGPVTVSMDKINSIRKTIGDNALIEPTVEAFRAFIERPEHTTVVLETLLQGGEMVFRDGTVDYRKILAGPRLDHIRFLALGAIGLTRAPVWDRDLVRALQAKGTGLISATHFADSSPEERLDNFVASMVNADLAGLPAYYLPTLAAPHGAVLYWLRFP